MVERGLPFVLRVAVVGRGIAERGLSLVLAPLL